MERSVSTRRHEAFPLCWLVTGTQSKADAEIVNRGEATRQNGNKARFDCATGMSDPPGIHSSQSLCVDKTADNETTGQTEETVPTSTCCTQTGNDSHDNWKGVEIQQLDTLGVSVYHLKHNFLEEEVFASKHIKTGNPLSRSSKIYDIENLRGPAGVIRKKGSNTICPLDGKMGAAYVHCLQGEDHVGEATHMLSYSWDYSIGDVVDTLCDFCLQNNLDPKRTYIWICCLCVNQHRVVENAAHQMTGMIAASQVDFFSIFGDRVKRIGHLLSMMAPWKAPVALTRVWCIFEIFMAHTTKECKVDIIMPPKEKGSLEQDVITSGGGINALYETLGNTKVENAKASVESDRLAILSRVDSGVGFHELNNQVNDLLRGWMLHVLLQLVETRENTNNEDYVNFCNQVGAVLERNGEHDAAMKLHRAALSICETKLGEHNESTATTYVSIGWVLYAKGEYDDALAKLKKALAIQEAALGETHPSVATSLHKMGCVQLSQGCYEGALAYFRKGLLIRESVLGKNHPDVARSYNNIGSVLDEMGDYEGALAKYEESLNIKESVFGKNHPSLANTYSNVGMVLEAKGDFEGALSRYQQALVIRESVLGKTHSDTASSYHNIGSVMDEMGDFDGALLMYQEALVIQQSTLGQSHPSVATTYHNLGVVLEKMGDNEGALVKYMDALAIKESVLGKNHPSAANTYSNIDSLVNRKSDTAG
ncbi:Kinesin light chain [Seminavis robusta]|uniref:Kinesin light chain n=1 Tax=Seminavis robusta TaxID=568900 RepID=A0A9N8DZT0_9STRA|nr:Kinesin light chain [Seminavis robusta]|eukprot:Sro509_g156950.1 Kinesin light chain (709) ;mRNA; f:3713-5839